MYNKFFRLFYFNCVFAVLPLMAHAELSTREAWENTKRILETGGYQVFGEEVSLGSDLSIRDAKIVLEVDEQTDIIFDVESLSLNKKIDGFIYLSLPQEINVQYINEDDFGYKTQANILIRARDLELKVSGQPKKILYEMTASSAGFALVELLDNGVPSTDFTATMELVLADIKSVIKSTSDEANEIKSMLSASGASIKGGVNLLSIPLELSFQYVMDQLKSSSVSNEPEVPIDEDFELALEKGFSSTSNFSFDKSELGLNANAPGGPLSLSFSSGPASLTNAISEAGLIIQSDNQKTVLNFKVPSNGWDFELDFEEFGAAVNIPLLVKTGEQEFGMSIKLSGLNLSDTIWNFFDADNIMLNQPATLEFDIEGSTVLVEGLTSEAIIGNQNLNPLEIGQILSFKLNDFLLDAFGVTVEANGDFEFDNEDFQTFDGIPRPMGKGSLKIQGSNAFIERLEGMLLFPSETIMGARMMLALLMRVEDDDTLMSEFEIDEKGKIYANGQRLR